MATGSCAFFRKLRPLRGWPAGILLFTKGATFFFAASVAWPLSAGDAAGVKGSLKGCAADVDVAAEGVCEEVESPCRGAVCVAVVAEMGAAFWDLEVDVRKRWEFIGVEVGILALEAARRQLRHIILACVVAVNCELMLACIKSLDAWLASEDDPSCFSDRRSTLSGYT
jgi:hypothetical protein